MAGTRAGGLKAAKANKERYGEDFYKRMGALGGSRTDVPKGFASDSVGDDGLTGRQRASIYGTKGGRKSKRVKVA